MSPAVAGESPMFPLGSPLLPHMLLPLRVFEPRYQVMTRRVLDGDGTFGVVMIERGSEVGGGDVRAEVGCRARIARADPLADGGWMLACVGVERLRVLRWLDDDPHPRAVVEPWPDQDGGEEPSLEVAVAAFHRVTSLLVELGVVEDASIDLADDVAEATYQMALSSPLGPLDRHRLLCAPSATVRAALLADMLDDAAVMLEARRDHPPG